jgi:hypothetical protein
MDETSQLDSQTLALVNELNAQGKYPEAYQAIIDNTPFYSGHLWFWAAAGVNGDSNFVSGFIRNYTKYADYPDQTLPQPFTKEQLDNASVPGP